VVNIAISRTCFLKTMRVDSLAWLNKVFSEIAPTADRNTTIFRSTTLHNIKKKTDGHATSPLIYQL
jgi:hypothetical protein